MTLPDSSIFRDNMISLKKLDQWTLFGVLKQLDKEGYTGSTEVPFLVYGKKLWNLVQRYEGNDKKIELYMKAKTAWQAFEVEKRLFEYSLNKGRESTISTPVTRIYKSRKPQKAPRLMAESQSPPEAPCVPAKPQDPPVVDISPPSPAPKKKSRTYKPIASKNSVRKPPIRGFCQTKRSPKAAVKAELPLWQQPYGPPAPKFTQRAQSGGSGSGSGMFYKKRTYCNV